MKGHCNIITENPFPKKGISLVELLVTITLVGLIFGMGISPVLSQLRLFSAERAEIQINDDLNLALDYISKDGIRASEVDVGTPNEVTFTITDYSSYPPSTITVRYYVANNTELRRDDSDTGTTITITNLIDTGNPPVFGPVENSIYLPVTIWLEDTDEGITATQRTGVMLRGRAAE